MGGGGAVYCSPLFDINQGPSKCQGTRDHVPILCGLYDRKSFNYAAVLKNCFPTPNCSRSVVCAWSTVGVLSGGQAGRQAGRRERVYGGFMGGTV